MNEIVQWVIAHWRGILLITYVVVNMIVALTPTPEDDRALRRVLERLSLLAPRDAIGTLKLPGFQPERANKDNAKEEEDD